MSPTGPNAFWQFTVDAVIAQLSSAANGLSSAEASKRLGARIVRKTQNFEVIELFFSQFKSPLVLLLIAAAILSFFLQDAVDATVIMLIVIVSGCLGFWQEWGAHDAVQKMMAIVQVKTTVLRDGSPVEIVADQIVCGDVLQLVAGATIPGDCLILESKDLFVDEAALTGETFPAEKHAGLAAQDAPIGKRANTLFQGTHVISGTTKAIVVQTGTQTEFGKISQTLQQKAPQTDFERGVSKLGLFLVRLTLIFVVAIFSVNVILHKPLLQSFMFSLALAVGLTPQLLPAIISVNLAGGARCMSRAKVIVKRLSAIESFGSMNVLCSDKTGTITEGVVQLQSAIGVDGQVCSKVLLYAYLNSSMETGFVNPIDEAIRKAKVAGAELYQKEDEVPYDFIRKRLSILVSSGGEQIVISKGALRNILDVCTQYEAADGSCPPLDQVREPIRLLMQEKSAQGSRVLGLAYKRMSYEKGIPAKICAADESAMTLAGLLVFSDPPKANIADTIIKLNKLGIALKIITGDNELVAEAVARQVGFKSPKVITSEELHKLDEKTLTAQVSSIDVFAGVEPGQKQMIIVALRQAGNVVGYIGDGINDASALHAADVAISVNNAVDVAKEAAQLVMLEHDLDVLVQAVQVGRTTFANTLKYIFMAISANFGNMFSMAGASTFLPFLPQLPTQVLLANLMADFPEMTIVTDSVDAEMVDRPGKWDMQMIRRFMLVFGAISSAFDYLTFAALIFIFHSDAQQFRTAWFTESLVSACLIVLVVRTRKPFFLSRPSLPMVVANLTVIALTLALPYTALGPLLGLAPLPPALLLAIALVTVCYLFAAEIGKQIFYRYQK